MTKLFIDENLSPDLQKPLESVFKKYRFSTAQRENLRGVEDVQLFSDVSARGFAAIITLDWMQTVNVEERDGLRAAGLHWIGAAQQPGSGVEVIAGLVAAVTAGLTHVFADWRDEPHMYRLGKKSHVADSIPVVIKI